MDKDLLDSLEEIDKVSPYANFLDKNTQSNVLEWIDTGSYVLNGIISGSLFGGIPSGRVTQLCGPSAVGKSLFIMNIVSAAQKMGKIAVVFDSENAIDSASAEKFGIDPSKVKYVPVLSIEQCRNSVFNFLKKVEEKKQTGKFLIAIDSLGNMESELQMSRMGKDNVSADVGSRAKAIKSLLRSCTQLAGLTQTTIVVTNHVYDDPMALFPSIEKNISGGSSVAYLPSVTVQLARKPSKETPGEDDKLAASQKKYTGVILRALTVKNRFIKQYLEGEMYLSFDYGLNRYYGLKDLAVGVGALIQTGSTFQLPDGKKLGYYKSFAKDKELWDTKIIPVIEEKIKKEWQYSAKLQGDENEELAIENEE